MAIIRHIFHILFLFSSIIGANADTVLTVPPTPSPNQSQITDQAIYVDQYASQVVGAPCFHDFVHDDVPCVQAALNQAGTVVGSNSTANGRVFISQTQPYWFNSQLVIPRGVTLGCAGKVQEEPVNTTVNPPLQNFTNLPCSFYIAPNNPINLYGALINAYIMQDKIHFHGQPTSVHDLATVIAGFAGTGAAVKSLDFDTKAENLSIAGFNDCYQSTNGARSNLKDILCDDLNGATMTNSLDANYWANVRMFPFYSTNRTIIRIEPVLTSPGAVDNGAGQCRLTTTTQASNAGTLEPLQTGDKVFVNAVNGLPSCNGYHTVGAIITPGSPPGTGPVTFDLTDAPTVPTGTGTVTSGSTYISSFSTTTLQSIAIGETISDTTGSHFIPSGTTVKAISFASCTYGSAAQCGIWISQAATGTVTADALTFGNPSAWVNTGGQTVSLDNNQRHGYGIKWTNVTGAVCHQCGTFQWDLGIWLTTNSNGNFFEASNTDGRGDDYNPATVCYRLDGTGQNFNIFTGKHASSCGTGIYSNFPGNSRPGFDDRFIGLNFLQNPSSVIEDALGNLELVNISGGAGPAGLTSNQSADVQQIVGANSIIHMTGSNLPTSNYYSSDGSLPGTNFIFDTSTTFGGYLGPPLVTPPITAAIFKNKAVSASTIANCGTGTPTITSWSTPAFGQFTTGTITTPLTCQVTFPAPAWNSQSVCLAWPTSGAITASGAVVTSATTDTVTWTFSAALSSPTTYLYLCGGT